MTARVLGLFAHPDDEVFAAGLLARCARAGAEVHVACATRGERGRPRDPTRFAQSSPSEIRTRELHASCRTLGAQPPIFLDLPDGALDRVEARGPGGAIPRVQAAIAALAPRAVVTLGRDGAYGHRDHLACTRWVAAAIEPLAGRVDALYAAFPRGLFTGLWRRLRRAPGVPIDASLTADDIGADVARADVVVDVRPVRDAKLRAIGAHRSQLAGDDPRSFLRPGLVDQLLDHEWYHTSESRTPGIADTVSDSRTLELTSDADLARWLEGP